MPGDLALAGIPRNKSNPCAGLRGQRRGACDPAIVLVIALIQGPVCENNRGEEYD